MFTLPYCAEPGEPLDLEGTIESAEAQGPLSKLKLDDFAHAANDGFPPSLSSVANGSDLPFGIPAKFDCFPSIS